MVDAPVYVEQDIFHKATHFIGEKVGYEWIILLVLFGALLLFKTQIKKLLRGYLDDGEK